jgi:hypothetical protein
LRADADRVCSHYAQRIKQPLNRAAIGFQVPYANSFHIRLGTEKMMFHPRADIGYYLIALGKQRLSDIE